MDGDQKISPASWIRGTPPGRLGVASRSPGTGSGRRASVPPIERRFAPPAGIYTGPDPVAAWPDRPGLARNGSKRIKGARSLIPVAVTMGAVVFALGAVRVAANLVGSVSPVIVHLNWWPA